MTDTVIIVGGGGGIGSALARRLARRGQALHLIGRTEETLSAVARDTGASFAVADVRDGAALEAAITAASGTLSGLAYCVGTITLRPLKRISVDEIMNDFAVNAAGAAMAVQAALPGLKEHDGPASVVLFSSVAVAQGFSGHASVGLAKGAVEGLTRSLAAELAPQIRVNAVAPSLTDTPLATAFTGNAAMVSSIAHLHALGRIGTAEDSAAAAEFLLSAEASWITGQVLGVDGGRATLRVKG